MYPNQAGGPWPPNNAYPGGPGYPPQTVYPGGPVAYPGYPPQTFQPGYPPPQAVYPGGPAAYPGYPPQTFQPGGPGYPLPAYTYGYYGWPPIVPPVPKRDTYTLVVGIAAFACSCITIIGGLLALLVLGIVNLASYQSMDVAQQFAVNMLFLTLAIAGIVGGSFCTYHSARSLFLRRPSRSISITHFGLFLILYLVTLGISYELHLQGRDTVFPALTALLIYMAATFPVLTILALGLRNLRNREVNTGPTTWRRLTLALVSGSTLSVLLAGVLELIFALLLFGKQGSLLQPVISSGGTSSDMRENILLLITLAVIAPVIEELVKPLAVVILIGRIRSKAEAFTLGLACGLGFNLVETTSYISQNYSSWLNVALVRSGAGLLHGFGAAMAALGWYYLTHKEEGPARRRILLASACALYAIIQHSLWNGFWGLALIPGPVGNFVNQWTLNLGQFSLDVPTLFNILEIIGILIFFLYQSGRLRRQTQVSVSAL